MHNCITSLKNAEGLTLESHQDIKTELVSYFEDILTENDQDRVTTIQEVTSHIPSMVTEEQNTMLMRPTTLQEVEIVVRQMKEDRAPSPDGFSVNFFHSC